MSHLLSNRWFLLILRLLLGGMLLYAGSIKVGNSQSFADSIATFQMLPYPMINLLALGLPVFEIMVGVMLVANFRTRWAALAACLLTTIFAVALAQALIRGLVVDCGCFGGGKPSAAKTWMSLGRDLLLLAIAGLLYVKESRWIETVHPSGIETA